MSVLVLNVGYNLVVKGLEYCLNRILYSLYASPYFRLPLCLSSTVILYFTLLRYLK